MRQDPESAQKKPAKKTPAKDRYFLYMNQKAVIKYNYMEQLLALSADFYSHHAVDPAQAGTRVAAAYDQIRGCGSLPGHSRN